MDAKPKNRALKNAQQDTPPPAAPEALIKVRALVPLHEDGHRAAGDEFETTATRAAALGDLVQTI